MFISVEGGEGVGKTTQMQLLKGGMPALFPTHNFVFTREPGGTPFSDKIREIILSPEAKHADGRTMFGLFAAARAEHLAQVIVPALVARKTVVTDRFAAATYAYQVVAQHSPVSHEFFEQYYYSLEALPRLTIILDMDPVVAQARVKARTSQDSNHFDERGLDFHMRLREGYARFARNFSALANKVVIVDADGSEIDVHTRILDEIRKIL